MTGDPPLSGPPPSEESFPPRPGVAVASLTLIFATVALMVIALHWPAPFDDPVAWGLRGLLALVAGALAATVVWRVAAYPSRPPLP